jgi:Ser/Thr protein kinase RdoA (MazF antagonist)
MYFSVTAPSSSETIIHQDFHRTNIYFTGQHGLIINY